MAKTEPEIVVHVVDHGQWFEQGLRVEYTRPSSEHADGSLINATLGTYEVLACSREQRDGHVWLTVSLRRFGNPSPSSTGRIRRRRQPPARAATRSSADRCVERAPPRCPTS